jgi:magnesium chelatase subunit D
VSEPTPSEGGSGVALKGHVAVPLGFKGAQEAFMAADIGPVFKPRRLSSPLDRLTRSTAGKRSFTKTTRKRGRYVQSRPANGKADDLALDATLRHAALSQTQKPRSDERLRLEKSDWQRKVRVRRAANLILFVVDASWSMAASERIEATKGAIFSLLTDAYQRRDQVGLVVFQREESRLELAPTSSVELAKEALKDIPVGGKTPLSGGLALAYRVIKQALRKDAEAMPLMILLTDGAGNVALTKLPPQEEALRVAKLIARSGIRSVVVNMEHPSFDRGLARELADALKAPCYTLKELRAQELYQTVRDELASER